MNLLIWGPSWFPSNIAAIGFTLFTFTWLIAESINHLIISRANSNRKNRKDSGSQLPILIAVFVSIFISVYVRYLHVGTFIGAQQYLGLALGFFGIFFREWAIASLGKSFTVKVETEAGGKLITRGPYKHIRHPSYLGAILTLVSLPIAIGTWPGIIIALVLTLPAYSYRMKVEEKAMTEAFGSEYSEYKRRTWRLIPGY